MAATPPRVCPKEWFEHFLDVLIGEADAAVFDSQF